MHAGGKSTLASVSKWNSGKAIASKKSSVTDALSYLCEYLLELLELAQSIWFLFYPQGSYRIFNIIFPEFFMISTHFP